jgi:hypothetical protein
MSLGKKTLDVARFEVVIVHVDLRAHLDFLHLDDLLVFLRDLALLRKVVFVFPEIKYPADGWVGVRRNLNEIEPPLGGGLQGVLYFQGPQLLALRIYDEDLPGSDELVDLGSCLARDAAMKTCDNVTPLKMKSPAIFHSVS